MAPGKEPLNATHGIWALPCHIPPSLPSNWMVLTTRKHPTTSPYLPQCETIASVEKELTVATFYGRRNKALL